MFREEIVLEPWPNGNGGILQFRLVLRGHLPPDKRGKADDKQRIRRELHPQLRTLWQQHPMLSEKGSMDVRNVEDIATQYSRNGFRFVPLVREDKYLACSLDILILRRGEPHRVFSGTGDLDGRVKTLIDGLRMPRQLSELGGQAAPSADEDPFFCLLEDDGLIFDFAVTTDRLLIPPDANEPERDIVAIIGVKVKLASGSEIAAMSDGF